MGWASRILIVCSCLLPSYSHQWPTWEPEGSRHPRLRPCLVSPSDEHYLKPDPKTLQAPVERRAPLVGVTPPEIRSNGSDYSPLQIDVVHQHEDAPDLRLYLSGTDPDGALVFLQANGEWYRPLPNVASGSPITGIPDELIAVSLGKNGSTTSLSLPSYLSAGRIWFANGRLNFSVVADASAAVSLVEPSIYGVGQTDPATTSWGFVELTYTQLAGLWANISYVDFVDMILGMFLSDGGGSTQATPGLSGDAISSICATLMNQTRVDSYPWGDLCVYGADGRPVRILSPTSYIQQHPQAFAGYWDTYLDQVWARYRGEVLTINTQASDLGDIPCRINGEILTCTCSSTGRSATYSRPTAADIFGCNSGPFDLSGLTDALFQAVTPRLCAAINRATLHLNEGNIQPNGPSTSSYYIYGEVANRYSQLVHRNEAGGRGYAFSYDDVASDGDQARGVSQSGIVSSTHPGTLTIVVGGS